MQEDFKPCDALNVADFIRHPVWSFDTDREGVEGADETWVSPFDLSFVPDDRAGLFLRAAFRCVDGGECGGALTVSFQGGTPIVDGLVFLAPGYQAVMVRDSRVALIAGMEMPRWLAGKFPVHYSGVLRAGSQAFALNGRVSL